MGVLEDLSKFADRTVRDVGDSLTNFGQDAQAAFDQATRNTAALAGSGVGANGKITGPLGDALGHDPFAFVLNLASKTRKDLRVLLIRYSDRRGKVSFTFQTPQGARKVTARPPTNANANQLALTFVLAALDGPATLTEEAGRMANGLPVKDRGLAGYTVFPMTLPSAPLGQPRGLFGIDDAAILAIVVPIIAAIAAAVLPGLISAAGNVIKQVTGGGGPSPEEQAAAQQAAQQEEQKKTITTVVIIGVVVIVAGAGLYFATRKKG